MILREITPKLVDRIGQCHCNICQPILDADRRDATIMLELERKTQMRKTTLEERILANARVDECIHTKDFVPTCERLVEQGKLVRGPHWDRRTCYRLAPPSTGDGNV